jgi:hypothetical protein
MYCSGRGPAIQVPGASGATTCAGKVAENTFRYGICVCEGVAATGLKTDSLDSRTGTSLISGGAAVGINRTYSISNKAIIGGSFFLASNFSSSAAHTITGDLHVGGDLSTSAPIEVSRDAWVGGAVRGPAGSLSTGRDFYNPQGTTFAVMAKGGVHKQAVTVSPPCACDPAQLLDVSAVVAEGKTNNHNALAGISPDRLDGVSVATVLALPCGRFYLDSIRSGTKLTLKIEGRTALYVGGDISGSGLLDVEIGPQGEFDRPPLASTWARTSRLRSRATAYSSETCIHPARRSRHHRAR